ncbi:MAG TPA: hypothetical protein VGP68_24160 [Gemmataceae bacterium]|nr:hypothetical protein [Gemmataceae bacterium]
MHWKSLYRRSDTFLNLQSKRELEATRKKVQDLEQLYAATQADSSQSGYGRDLTLRSLRSTLNQLKEEIARFEAHTKTMSQIE